VGGARSDSDNFWGALVFRLRQAHGIGRRRLCKALQLNVTTFRRFEEGLSPGRLPDVEAVLAFFGYELEAVQRGKRPSPPQTRARSARLHKNVLPSETARV
jgi:transcriptional regulator with XRE-family HTH domain